MTVPGGRDRPGPPRPGAPGPQGRPGRRWSWPAPSTVPVAGDGHLVGGGGDRVGGRCRRSTAGPRSGSAVVVVGGPFALWPWSVVRWPWWRGGRRASVDGVADAEVDAWSSARGRPAGGSAAARRRPAPRTSTTTTTTIRPRWPAGAGGSSTRARAAGPGRSVDAGRLAGGCRRHAGRGAGRRRRRAGSPGSGNSSLPRTGTGGTEHRRRLRRAADRRPRLAGAAGLGRTGPPGAVGPARTASARCSRVPRAEWYSHRVRSSPSGRRSDHHEPPRPPRPVPRRPGRSTSRLFNPKRPAAGSESVGDPAGSTGAGPAGRPRLRWR